MSLSNKTDVRRKPRRKRAIPEGEPGTGSFGSVSLWFILCMAFIGVVCLLIGCVRHGVEWRALLTACCSLAAGIGCVAIGLLEPEWLERIIGFVDGIFSGISQYFWTTRVGSMSDFLGRRGARVFWLLVGFPTFVWGCLLGLRIL